MSYIFFGRPNEQNGWLGNWYTSPFTLDVRFILFVLMCSSIVSVYYTFFRKNKNYEQIN